MTVFTTEELNLICIYDPGNRKGTIKELSWKNSGKKETMKQNV